MNWNLLSWGYIGLAVLIAAGLIVLTLTLIRLYHRFCPYHQHRLADEWILSGWIEGRDRSPQEMAVFARSFKVRRRSSDLTRHLLNGAYLNLQYIQRQLTVIPARTITAVPAIVWVFENYNLLSIEIKKLQVSLTSSATRYLPVVDAGSGRTHPRVLLLALKILAMTDNQIDERSIRQLLDVYQSEQELTSAELWLLPHFLTLCLLRAVLDESLILLPDIRQKSEADELAEQIAQVLPESERAPDRIRFFDSQFDRRRLADPDLLTHLLYRLRSLSIDETALVPWIASIYRISEEAMIARISEQALAERRREAMAEARIGLLIRSLNAVDDLDWDIVFGRISRLEHTLDQDPSGDYPVMDDPTRGRYREVCEKLARRFRMDESAVARQAIALSEERAAGNRLPRPDHVGSYLVDGGVRLLRDRLAGREPIHRGSLRRSRRIRMGLFAAGGLLLASLFLIPALYVMVQQTGGSPLFLLLAAVPFAFLALHAGIFLMRQLYSRLFPARRQLAMDYTQSIPDLSRTFVVMPVIVSQPQAVTDYIAKLEKYYLANRQSNLFFALLMDYADASQKTMPGDRVIRATAEDAIAALNEKYPGEHVRFSLFIRNRVWNQADRLWMSWERKRGKLEEFNALLCGEPDTGFLAPIAAPHLYPTFRYVLTLDADTDLVRDTAAAMVAVMAHPLNRPVLDKAGKRVISGYAIVQSEVGIHVQSAKASLFARIVDNNPGIDSYARVLADIYQDAFGEGSFVGKGIYDFRTLHQLLRDRIPENSILSHDLLEGALTRCAFAGGIRLMDNSPSNLLAAARRDHRWMRGDWQLLPWIFLPSVIRLLDRWKMLDNLRRSLLAPFSMWAILANLALMPETPWLWLPYVLFVEGVSPLLTTISLIWSKLDNWALRFAWRKGVRLYANQAANALLQLITLPYRAYQAMDAIVRSLFRMLFSRRRLLEWQTSESVEASQKNRPGVYLRAFWPHYPAVALVVAATVYFGFGPAYLAASVLLALLWLTAPLIGWYIGLSTEDRQARRQRRKDSGPRGISATDAEYLRRKAHRTWLYFADLANEQNHWLSPDNHQVKPGPRTSHKTSPTNIGMQLLSALTAADFGFIGVRELIEHGSRVLSTLQSLPKWRGHLYNWYDTQSLEVLKPDYISTVDSGNFTAHLLTFANGLSDIADRPLFDDRLAALFDLERFAGLAPDWNLDSLDDPESRARILGKLDGPLPPVSDPLWSERIRQSRKKLAEDGHDFFASEDFHPKWSLREWANRGSAPAIRLLDLLEANRREIAWIVGETDFAALYDVRLRQFYIGYRVSDQEYDQNHYDLLASEARVASLLAIAKGDVPQKHWFALGRPLKLVSGEPALVSWSGTMFEYLMPNLILKTPEGTLLERSCRAALAMQIKHAREQQIPWGISESQYYLFDAAGNYQYHAFGINYLRLQSSIRPSRVIAPYATVLALSLDARKAVRNLRRLDALEAGGLYGWYEALDFNQPDVSGMREYTLVSSFMAHHQGMSLCAIGNLLLGNRLQQRFHAEPMIQASEILLEESRPDALVVLSRHGYSIHISQPEQEREKAVQYRVAEIPPVPSAPVAHVLSNNRYTVVATRGGQGFSRRGSVAINRWRPVMTGEMSYGQFIYVRDMRTGQYWSTGYCPTYVPAAEYRAIFTPDQMIWQRRDGMIRTQTELTVSAADDLEIRRVRLSNLSDQPIQLETTSYLEAVNDTQAAESSHPAFNKLFLQTEYVASSRALICSRRSRGADEQNGVIFHLIRPEVSLTREIEFETDRRAFIGRGGSTAQPAALKSFMPLRSNADFPFDPILSLRASFVVPPGRTVTVVYYTGWAPDRKAVLHLCDDHARLDPESIFRMAATSSKLEMRFLNLDHGRHNAIQALVGPIFYPNRRYRGSLGNLAENQLGQPGLWRFGISGDDPILLLQVGRLEDLTVVADVLQAYEFLRLQAIQVDLVIINEERAGYEDALQQRILQLTGMTRIAQSDAAGRIHLFVIRRADLSDAELTLLHTCARVVFGARNSIWQFAGQDHVGVMQAAAAQSELEAASRLGDKTVAGQTASTRQTEPTEQPSGAPANAQQAAPARSRISTAVTADAANTVNAANAAIHQESDQTPASPVIHLPSGKMLPSGQTEAPIPAGDLFYNGIGSFSADGREYRLRLGPNNRSPVPWSNVIANEDFGFITTETGGGYTWRGNSRENKLTTWSNDPLIDPPSEAIYVRDDDNNAVTSPAALCAGHGDHYEIRHGFGYSVYRHHELDLDMELTLYVPPDQPLKLMRLRVRNQGGTTRKLSLFAYAEWLLGDRRENTLPYVVTAFDRQTGLFTAVNVFREKDRQHPAFLFTSEPVRSFSGNREAFLGFGPDIRYPAAMARPELDGAEGAGYDPCGAIQVPIELAPNTEKAIFFGLGQADTTEEAAALAKAYSSVEAAEEALQAARDFWKQRLGSLIVRTPEPAFDLLINGWLLYQVMSCRMFARAAFYQSGGAYGYRDQLQDSLALLDSEPERCAAQIRRCACHQFEAGDVQHWWHPPDDIGVRTRISDDLLWLPYAVAEYLTHTGDRELLFAEEPYLVDEPLGGEHEKMFKPQRSSLVEPIWRHCLRAIDRAAETGPHGLPLIGGGDWNDGMNRVGIEGRGESVWLAWFYLSVLKSFAPILTEIGEDVLAVELHARANLLRDRIEASAWDGNWYLRAWFDDGTPLGSRQNEECQIDSISQSWSVLSGGGDPARAAIAIESARRYLAHPEEGLIALLAPPFDRAEPNPGYIRGYLPGVRENGGQYTHAAIWLAMAFGKRGRGREAMELLRLLNPILATDTHPSATRYENEPYVVSADIYRAGSLTGKAGWSWYTGSAGWMYQALVRVMLGFTKTGRQVNFQPMRPLAFDNWYMELKHGSSVYEIDLVAGDRDQTVIDSQTAEGTGFTLVDDGAIHAVRITLQASDPMR